MISRQRLATLLIMVVMLLALVGLGACAPQAPASEVTSPEAQAVRSEEVSAEEAPAGEVQVEDAPVEEVPAEDTPVEEAQVEETPAGDAQVEAVQAEAAEEMMSCDGTLTPAQTEGPFYTPNTPERTNLVEEGMSGTPVLVTGKVLNQACEPVAGAMVDFWQADDAGQYDNVGYRLRGHQFTDEAGNYRLETIMPALYSGGRTPHIHVKVFAPDGRDVLTSQIYFQGESEQVSDSLFRSDLIAHDLEPDESGRRHVRTDFVVNVGD